MSIKSDFLVEKRNALNEVRNNNLTLQELRFFSIYLAKINARDISTRVVRFSVSDFQRIMELGKIKLKYLSAVTDSLLCKIIRVRLESGGLESFQLFKECRIDKDEKGAWYVEIDAHDKSLPLMFEFKERYFTYALWNALKLKSSNQLRMYEILKQYECLGERIIGLDDLKELLGLSISDYPRFDNFKMRVLDVCQRALAENTDIKFAYEAHGRKGKGGKILQLKFIISKNKDYIDQLSLDEFINHQEIAGISVTNKDPFLAQDTPVAKNEPNSGHDDGVDYFVREIYPFLADACENEFNLVEMQVLYDLVVKVVPYKATAGGKELHQLEAYNYLKRKYDELVWRASRAEIRSRFGYLKKIIEVDSIIK